MRETEPTAPTERPERRRGERRGDFDLRGFGRRIREGGPDAFVRGDLLDRRRAPSSPGGETGERSLDEAIAWLDSDDVFAGPRTLAAIRVVLSALRAYDGPTHEERVGEWMGKRIGHVGWLLTMADKWPDNTEAEALRTLAHGIEHRDREWLALRDYLGIPMIERVDDWLRAYDARPPLGWVVVERWLSDSGNKNAEVLRTIHPTRKSAEKSASRLQQRFAAHRATYTVEPVGAHAAAAGWTRARR